MIAERYDCDLICLRHPSVNHPHPSVTFAGVAKVSDFQVCLELTVWYTHELTLSGCARRTY
jgi:hypothetical protein